jgi:hypothetical protein
MFAMMTAVLLASSPVSLQFDGPLKDGLKQLAEKSGLNLVVIGEFDEKVQLNLPNVDGPEALETIALAYGLEVTRKGAASNLWVVRKAGGAIPKAPPVLAVAPVPPVPPVAVATPNVNSDALRSAAETAREEAEQAREEAERIREKLESLRGASAEAREKVQEALEQAREKAQEAAEEAREKAEEAREAAQEQAEQAREAARDQAEALRESAQAQAELSREKARLVREQMALQRHKVSTGGPITIEKGTRVEAAVAYGGPVIVEEGAVVDGDAVAFGGDVVLKAGAVVEGDAVSFGGTVVRDDTAVVRGDAVSMGGANFGAQVARNVVRKERAERAGAKDAADEADSPSSNGGRGFAAFLLQFAVFFGLGFLLMMFAPNRMKALEATIRAEPAKNGLAGFLGLLATVPITAALVVTLVGIPVALMLWILVALFIPAGLAVVANAVGAKLPTGRMRKTQALVLAVGLLALLLVGHIPVLGPMVLAVAVFVSMGAIIRTRFGQTGKGLPMLDPLQQTAPMV